MSRLSRIQDQNFKTWNPTTGDGAPGELVTDSTGAQLGAGIVLETGAGKAVAPVLIEGLVTVALANAAGGVLTRTVTVTVEDVAGNPIEDAIVLVGLHATVALVSVAAGLTGTMLACVVVGNDAFATVKTGVAGTADLTVVVGGAGDGDASAQLLSPQPGTGETTWTF